MNSTVSISAMFKFHFGSRIVCTDGEEGVLTSLGFDPTTRQATFIGVRQGRLFGRTSYLSFHTVTGANRDGVMLNIPHADLEAAPKATPGAVFFDSKSTVEVEGVSGRGNLTLVAVQPQSGSLAYLVVHRLRSQDTMLRQEFVKRLEQERILVAIPEATLHALPPYRTDNDLQQEVENVLFDFTPLHVDFKGMDIRVLDSVLYLTGNISSSLRADVAQDQVSAIPGLLEIKNELIADDELAADLAAAFGKDARTHDLPIGIYPKLGVVRLGGAVHTAQQKAVAEEIARSFPGVRGVSNTLVVDESADLLRVMAPAEGGEAEDLIPGRYIRHTK